MCANLEAHSRFAHKAVGNGTERFPPADGVEAVSLPELCRELEAECGDKVQARSSHLLHPLKLTLNRHPSSTRLLLSL